MPEITATNISKHYGSVRALHNVHMHIKNGEYVVLLGPSGCGKTTLLKIIAGTVEPSSGTIMIGKQDVTTTHPEDRHIGFVFQNYALFPWLTALNNVAFGLRMAGMRKTEARKTAKKKLEEVGLGHLENHYPAALSGGQRQRVGLARALAISPDLLIMDEPFSNLDTITAESLKADLLKIWRSYGITILMVNHLIPDAVEFSDQIIVMVAHPGHIKSIIPIDLPRPRDTRSAQFFKEVDLLTEATRAIS